MQGGLVDSDSESAGDDPESESGGGTVSSDTLVGTGSKLLTMFIKRATDKKQLLYISTLLADHEASLIFLSFIKSRILTRKGGSVPSPKARELGKKKESISVAALQQERAISACCRLLWTLCKHLGPRFVQECVDHKGPTVMRDVLNHGGENATVYALRMLKAMLPYLGKKWRQNNIHIVSAVYEKVKPESFETWLVACKKDDFDEDPTWGDMATDVGVEMGLESDSSGYESSCSEGYR